MYGLQIGQCRIPKYPLSKWQSLRALQAYLLTIPGYQFFLNVHNIKKFSLEQIMKFQTGSRDMVMFFL